MFDIYQKKKDQPLYYVAIGSAVVSFFIAFFFRAYFKLEQIPILVLFAVPLFVFNAVIDSDHRTRNKTE